MKLAQVENKAENQFLSLILVQIIFICPTAAFAVDVIENIEVKPARQSRAYVNTRSYIIEEAW